MSHNYDHKDKVDRAGAHIRDAQHLISHALANTPKTAKLKHKLLSRLALELDRVRFADLSYYYIPPKGQQGQGSSDKLLWVPDYVKNKNKNKG